MVDFNNINNLNCGFLNLNRYYDVQRLSISEGLVNIMTFIIIHPYGPALHTLCIVPIDHMTLKTHNSWAGLLHKHCTNSPLPTNHWLSCCETVHVGSLFCDCFVNFFNELGRKKWGEIYSIGCLCMDVHPWPFGNNIWGRELELSHY